MVKPVKAAAVLSYAQLLAAVHRQPDDDGPRQVLADALIERGDPRGEFIVLQIAGADERRQRRLLAAHEKSWLGPVAEVTKKDSRVWRRGFLDECTFLPRGKHLAAAVGHPAWASVRVFDFGSVDSGALPILMHPSMRGVRVIHKLGEHSGLTLSKASPPFAIEEIDGALLDDHGLWPFLLDPSGLPSLTKVTLTAWFGVDDDPAQLRPLWQSRLGRQLSVFRFKLYPHYFRAWSAEVLAHAKMAVEIDLNAWMRIDGRALSLWPSDSDLRPAEIKNIVAAALKHLPEGRFRTVEIDPSLRSPSVDRQANRLRGLRPAEA